MATDNVTSIDARRPPRPSTKPAGRRANRVQGQDGLLLRESGDDEGFTTLDLVNGPQDVCVAVDQSAGSMQVVPIRRRPLECERALALMEEARDLLDRLVESGRVELGSCPDTTRAYLDDAIGMLTPNDEKVDDG